MPEREIETHERKTNGIETQQTHTHTHTHAGNSRENDEGGMGIGIWGIFFFVSVSADHI